MGESPKVSLKLIIMVVILMLCFAETIPTIMSQQKPKPLTLWSKEVGSGYTWKIINYLSPQSQDLELLCIIENDIYSIDYDNGKIFWEKIFDYGVIDAMPIRQVDSACEDVIVATGSKVDRLSGSTGNVLWEVTLDYSLLTLSNGFPLDFNDDGVEDVAVADRNGNIYVLSGVNGNLIWKYSTGKQASHGYVIFIRSGSSWNIIAYIEDTLFALDKNGVLLWSKYIGTYPLQPLPQQRALARSYDTNGDSVEEVFVATRTNGIYLLSGANGETLWSKPIADIFSISLPVADINGDGVRDIAVSTTSGYIYMLSGINGEVLWSELFNVESPVIYITNDMNDNGFRDFVITDFLGDKALLIESSNGEILWEYIVDAPLEIIGTIRENWKYYDADGDSLEDVPLGIKNTNTNEGIITLLSGGKVIVTSTVTSVTTITTTTTATITSTLTTTYTSYTTSIVYSTSTTTETVTKTETKSASPTTTTVTVTVTHTKTYTKTKEKPLTKYVTTTKTEYITTTRTAFKEGVLIKNPDTAFAASIMMILASTLIAIIIARKR